MGYLKTVGGEGSSSEPPEPPLNPTLIFYMVLTKVVGQANETDPIKGPYLTLE